MKKQKKEYLFSIKAICLGFFLLTLSFIPLITAQSITSQAGPTSNQMILTYSFEYPTIHEITIENKTYDEVFLSDMFIVGEPGDPCLPLKGCFILLPPQSSAASITVLPGDEVYLGDGFFLKPAGDIVPVSQRNDISPLFVNTTLYNSNNLFPGKLYETSGVYKLRGYSILMLNLFPVQYKPLSGELKYYTEFTVVITLNQETNLNRFYRGNNQDGQIVSDRVDNPDMVAMYPTSNYCPIDSYDLLILTTDELKDGFEPLKNFHNYRGVRTIIKTLTDVNGDTPEHIREYIRDAYADWGIEYVLIGGDDSVIPARILWVLGMDEGVTPYETYMPSDLYYACLDGPYNYNGNDKWGEPDDGEDGGDVDLLAEVFVGRACVDNLNDVSNFVSKTIAYISEDSEDDYFTKVVLAGEYLGNYGVATWGGNYLDQLIDECSDDGYTTVGIPTSNYSITTLYDRDWSGNNWPKSEIKNLINSNVHIINHLGHAYYGYSLKMNNNDVYDLTNEKYCFIYSQGCMAGGFDNPDGYDCIAEHLTVKTPHGAAAVIMNARYGWFWSYSTDGDSQRFNRAFWNAVFGKEIAVISRANQQSKEDNLPIINRSCIRWCYYQLNLFGDPTISFYDNPTNYPDIAIINVTGGMGIKSTIANYGQADATNIDWHIAVRGGLFNFVDNHYSGNILNLDINQERTIETDIFVGLGPIIITISATCNEGISAEKTTQGKHFLLYTKIL
ncbi:MAG: C25 family cysteine peptidase [Thermoplasmatota archaeon]